MMKKFVSTDLLKYGFESERKGAKYTIDGGHHYMNAGDFSEVALKNAFGLKAEKDANTAFDVGSDIELYHMSVKSSKATLCNEILGHDLETSMNTYFERTASTCWAWVIVMDGTVTAYIMNAAEFRKFMASWASYNTESRVRFKASSGKMIAWFEERVD